MAPRTVLLCGASLLLSGVAACLAESTADQRILRADSLDAAGPLIADRVPDVLICDVADAADARILHLMLRHPRLVLLGLDLERNRGVLLSAQESDALTVQQIQEIVQQNGS